MFVTKRYEIGWMKWDLLIEKPLAPKQKTARLQWSKEAIVECGCLDEGDIQWGITK